MALSQQRVSSLVSNEPDLRDAVGVVLSRSDGGDAEIDWRDVNDRLTSGQWGRLIQEGILVDGDEGFLVEDPETLRRILDAPDDDTDDGTDEDADGQVFDVTDDRDAETDDDDGSDSPLEDVDTGWSRYDKVAALGAGVMFLGYFIPQERNTLAHVFDILFGNLDAALPFFMVILSLSLVTGMYSAILQANLMDNEAMQAIQGQMNDIRERKKEAKENDDEEALEAIREEEMAAMGSQTTLMKVQFRPTVWIMLLTVPVFLWMRWKIRGGHVDPAEMQMILPLVGRIGLRDGLVGSFPTWIVWYFLCSMGFGQIIRKSVGLQTGSTTDQGSADKA